MGILEGKIAVVTGGISGIGEASAKRFRDEGATVVVNARNTERAAAAQPGIGTHFDAVEVADMADLAAIEAMYAKTADTYGKIDVLFLNAGIGKLAPFEMTGEQDFDDMVAVNLKGSYFGVQKALPFLADGASVFFTTSVTNEMADPMTVAYAATKAGLASMARTMAIALKDRGIRVNALSPGPVATPIFGKAGIPPEMMEGLMEQVTGKIAVGRVGMPDDLAEAALFLASPASSYMTGTELKMDGGYSL